jgi:transcriptional regulator with XRE-family HTH domain
MKFAELLKKCRKAERYSTETLRDEIKEHYKSHSMSATVISQYEAGEKSPSSHRLAILCKILKMNPAEVLKALLEEVETHD